MLDIFEKYATDEALELTGTTVDIGGGAKIKVARSENENYSKRIIELCDKHRQVLDQNDAESRELDKKLMIQVMAETVLLGWENVSYMGKKITYSVQDAIILLKHKDFRVVVATESQRFANFKIKSEVADVKN